MVIAEQSDSDPATAGGALDGSVRSFGFWQQGLVPGAWSETVLSRNLDGEDFTGYRRASDPPHPGQSGTQMSDVGEEDIVVENAHLISEHTVDVTLVAIGRLVAAFGEESTWDEIDAEALVQAVRSDIYQIELVDTVADTSRRAGIEGSPMHAPLRGATASAGEDEFGAFGVDHAARRVTDQETARTDVARISDDFYETAVVGRPLIQSAEDFLIL